MKHIKLRGFIPNPERLKEIEECAQFLASVVPRKMKESQKEIEQNFYVIGHIA